MTLSRRQKEDKATKQEEYVNIISLSVSVKSIFLLMNTLTNV